MRLCRLVEAAAEARTGNRGCATSAMKSTSNLGNGDGAVRFVRRLWTRRRLRNRTVNRWAISAMRSMKAGRIVRRSTAQMLGTAVGWAEVHESLRRRWLAEGCLRRRDMKKHWND